MTSANPTPIIIDTDPGIDDAQAILMAFSEPSLEVVGLTAVFGNVDVDTATRNALHLTALAGMHVPVAKGMAVPRTQKPEEHATFVHGDSGFGNAPLPDHDLKALDESAVDFIIRMSHEHNGELVLVPIGPLTNIAAALDADPTLTQRIKRVVIMGGAVEWKGNVNEFAEANIWNDPHAAQMVFDAVWDVLIVGLDVTEKLKIFPQDMQVVETASPILGKWLSLAHNFYFDFHVEWYNSRHCFLHDPAAVLALIRPELFTIKPATISVTLEGDEKGNTNIAPGGGAVSYCADVDVDAATNAIMAASASLDEKLKGILS